MQTHRSTGTSEQHAACLRERARLFFDFDASADPSLGSLKSRQPRPSVKRNKIILFFYFSASASAFRSSAVRLASPPSFSDHKRSKTGLLPTMFPNDSMIYEAWQPSRRKRSRIFFSVTPKHAAQNREGASRQWIHKMAREAQLSPRTPTPRLKRCCSFESCHERSRCHNSSCVGVCRSFSVSDGIQPAILRTHEKLVTGARPWLHITEQTSHVQCRHHAQACCTYHLPQRVSRPIGRPLLLVKGSETELVAAEEPNGSVCEQYSTHRRFGFELQRAGWGRQGRSGLAIRREAELLSSCADRHSSRIATRA